jgi:enoyl-CoA hydratase/carnithine racemase
MSDSDRVLVSTTDHVAHVRLNRPTKRNGLDLPQIEAIVEVGRKLAGDADVRAVVLSGEGASFCAGLDWAAFLAGGSELAQRLLQRDEDSGANLAQRCAWIWAELAVPVVAAVHGAAYGGGLQLALACDMRYVTADARLSVMEIRYGLIPDMTASRTLLRLVRDDIARELVYSGRIVDGVEAVRIGLATRVCDDPVADALATARQIGAASPGAIRAAKRLCLDTVELDRHGAFARETVLQLGLLGSADQMEAVQAAISGRPPVFR